MSNKAALSGETPNFRHTQYCGVICHWGEAGAAVTFCVTLLGDGFSGAAGSELHLAFHVLLQVLSHQEGMTSTCVQQSTEVEVKVPWFKEKASLLPPVQAGGDILVAGQMLSNDTETKSCCMFLSAEERQVWIIDFQEPF